MDLSSRINSHIISPVPLLTSACEYTHRHTTTQPHEARWVVSRAAQHLSAKRMMLRITLDTLSMNTLT